MSFHGHSWTISVKFGIRQWPRDMLFHVKFHGGRCIMLFWGTQNILILCGVETLRNDRETTGHDTAHRPENFVTMEQEIWHCVSFKCPNSLKLAVLAFYTHRCTHDGKIWRWVNLRWTPLRKILPSLAKNPKIDLWAILPAKYRHVPCTCKQYVIRHISHWEIYSTDENISDHIGVTLLVSSSKVCHNMVLAISYF